MTPENIVAWAGAVCVSLLTLFVLFLIVVGMWMFAKIVKGAKF